MSSDGKIYVRGPEGITKLSPEQVYKNRNNYKVITNSELLNLRETSPELAFDRDILTDMNNSTSMAQVIKQVNLLITNLGTKETEQYTKKEKDSIVTGYKELIGGGPDGYYKINTKQKGTTLETMRYINTMLGSSTRNYLKAVAVAEGGSPDDYITILQLALSENTNKSQTSTYDKEATGTSGSTGGKGGMDKTGWASYMTEGDGRQQKTLLYKNGEYGISAQGVYSGSIYTKDMNSMPTSTLNEVLDKSLRQ